jgi:hypothetical protein
MLNNRSIWLIVLGTVLFFGAALVTLRAAEQATRPAPSPAAAATGAVTPGAGTSSAAGRPAPTSGPTHPPPSAPEESATISDDPVTAPDASQSADNNVSFPTDI